MPASAASFRYLASNYLADHQQDANHLMQKNYHSISMTSPNKFSDQYFWMDVPAVATGASTVGYNYSSADAWALPNKGGPSLAALSDGGGSGSNNYDTTRTSPPRQIPPPFTIPPGFQAPQLQVLDPDFSAFLQQSSGASNNGTIASFFMHNIYNYPSSWPVDNSTLQSG